MSDKKPYYMVLVDGSGLDWTFTVDRFDDEEVRIVIWKGSERITMFGLTPEQALDLAAGIQGVAV